MVLLTLTFKIPIYPSLKSKPTLKIRKFLKILNFIPIGTGQKNVSSLQPPRLGPGALTSALIPLVTPISRLTEMA